MKKKRLLISLIVITAVVVSVLLIFKNHESNSLKKFGIESNGLKNNTDKNSDITNIKIVYSHFGSSTPFSTDDIVTISTDAKGAITSEYVKTKLDSTDVVSKKLIIVTADHLKKLITSALKIKPTPSHDSNSGCTGGTSTFVKITQGDKKIMEGSNFICQGESNKSFDEFQSDVESLIQQ